MLAGASVDYDDERLIVLLRALRRSYRSRADARELDEHALLRRDCLAQHFRLGVQLHHSEPKSNQQRGGDAAQ